MFTQTDYDKLQQIMAESPEKKELLTRLLSHHRMEISTISHEIRNPLTLVYSNLQFLENEFPELLPSKHWKNMHQDIEYMKQLLEELSDFNNGDRLSLQSLDTNTFLRSVALSFATSILDTDIQMTSKIPPALPVIQADPVKLRQLLLNLLTNAKAAVLSPALKNPEQLPSIFLEARLAEQSLVIEIRDNGCGITSEQRDKIFEPFVTYKKRWNRSWPCAGTENCHVPWRNTYCLLSPRHFHGIYAFSSSTITLQERDRIPDHQCVRNYPHRHW